ncbi:MAG: putative rane protein [Noviherbaspirillum sp.]|jgi:hypothetical protein|nr:putative rane protein [Noviherbaspirillum sp.]MDB5795837.1 putative rane protein [Noviherbaspirillum sp.]
MKLARARLPIATLWTGSLWTIGYIVAPTLFATLTDRVLAGTIAGSLFRVEAWLSVACAILLLLLPMDDVDAGTVRRTRQLVVAMLCCTLVGYFGLQPFMAALREGAGPGGLMDAEAKVQFGILHGVASAVYLVQSLLGLVLILKLR